MLTLLINNAPVYVEKKDGTLEDYNSEKILAAISKAEERCLANLTDNEKNMIIAQIEKHIIKMSNNIIPVKKMHTLVERTLKEFRPDIAESYSNYRSLRIMWNEMLHTIFSKTKKLLFLGDKSNSNANSKLASTISNIMSDYLGSAMTSNFLYTKEERQAMKEGYIYGHDQGKKYYYPFNCCLFDISKVLTGGFEMSNIWYNEPKSIDVCFDVIGDIALMAASQQFGGFTLPEIDFVLEPYAEKSYQSYLEKYLFLNVEKKLAEKQALNDVTKDILQGFQGWEYKFNTVASSRGDYPFITITFGLNYSKWGKIINKALLKVRREGQGEKGKKKPVLFPKLVFLYDKNLHGPGKELEDVFQEGILCSSKTMYPDWLSLTGEGYVPSIYKKYGLAISPMGCRAFLSPWYERGGMEPADEYDKPIFIGRFNIGVLSLNLPLIYQKAKTDNINFYDLLYKYLNMIRNIHIRTYDWIGQMPASRNPLAFCQEGLYGGNLDYNEKIKPLLKSATASFGITALNELQMLHNKKSLVQDGHFALEVLTYINQTIESFKKEDGYLYAVYGTPAESLCGKQVEQFRAMFGIIEGVSDREYVSNSFHCHVTERITPIQKQDLEYRFWNLCNGGKIQYVKYIIDYNYGAIATLVRRAMDMGFYEGVNLSLSFCDNCGYQAVDMGDTCPICGSSNLTKIDRMNGYLSYSRVQGDTRLNDAKMAEINERISM